MSPDRLIDLLFAALFGAVVCVVAWFAQEGEVATSLRSSAPQVLSDNGGRQ